MKLAFCSLVVTSSALLLCASTLCEFLPEPNGDEFGLEYGESIAGVPANPPKIDGKLDDWKHAVWIAFDSEDELLRGQVAMVFMDWGGVEPDQAINLGKLIFGGPLAVDPAGKLAATWGEMKRP